jgi:hypothetical protein
VILSTPSKPRVELLQVVDPKQLKLIDDNSGSGTLALNEELPESGIYKILIQNKLGTRGSYFVCLENGIFGGEHLGWTQPGEAGKSAPNPLTLLSFMVPRLTQGSPTYNAIITVGPKSSGDKPAFHVGDGEFFSISSPGVSSALKIKASIQPDKKGVKFEIYTNSIKSDMFSLGLGKTREIKDGLVVELADIIKIEPAAPPSNGGQGRTGRCCVSCGGTTSCGCAVDDTCGSCCSSGCCYY